jgi:hypothetical protein
MPRKKQPADQPWQPGPDDLGRLLTREELLGAVRDIRDAEERDAKRAIEDDLRQDRRAHGALAEAEGLDAETPSFFINAADCGDDDEDDDDDPRGDSIDD